MLYLGLEGHDPEVPHHTIYLTQDYVRNLKDIESRHVLSPDPLFYVQNPCITDPSLAPPGMSALYVLVPVTHQHANVDWQREAPGFRALTLRQLKKIGLHDVERRIRYESCITPADWEQRHAVYLRPRNRFEDLDAVYLVGGGTHPGSGLPVIFESARITTPLLLDDLGLSTHWTMENWHDEHADAHSLLEVE